MQSVDIPGGMVERSQQLLIDLLQIDLGLAFNFLRSAALSGSEEHRDMAIQKARDALRGIRQLSVRIIDSNRATEIAAKADDLEAAIASASD